VRDYAIFTLDAEGRVDSWTASAQRLFGFADGEVAGEYLTELAVGAESEELKLGLTRARETGRFEAEAGARRADGVIFLGSFTLSPLSGDDGRDGGFAVVVSDVTQSRRTERQLRHMALHDTLTGLPNRALLTDRLTVALASVERDRGYVAVLFCDVDRFKVINDSLGHEAGDVVLSAVAGRLREVVRPEDTVARIGGDEFVVCCREVADAEHAVALAERIRATLAEPIVVGGEPLYVGLSVGIALGNGADRADHLLRDADMAMYRAKQGGTGYALAEEGDRSRALGRLRGEAAIRRAFEHKELTLHYQPIVDLPDRKIVALEALLRWNHPVDGLLGPGEIIPIAEETGAIVPIGAWVIEEALAAGQRFRAGSTSHAGLVMNVNVSPRQLASEDLVDTVARALVATNTDPSLLCLELTETELIEDLGTYAAVLEGLESLGVRIAIDDFGAGYSSLRYLSRLPIRSVKLDRSFVAGLHTDEGGAPILRAAVSMASAFGLDAVAEGIESEDDAVALVQMGYRLAQGFHFARPVPEADAAALLARQTPAPPRSAVG
jgi:diguanylate cyclase (GGDEF)-like protein/PAS domain S-box-containing protein